jgi:hypothetical protein
LVLGAAALALLGPMCGAARSDAESPGPLEEGNPAAPAALARCGACHMAYPSRMLPARSWTAILTGMDRHFGQNVAIAEKDLVDIRNYLTSNAADSPNAPTQDRHFMSGLFPDSTPLRITATPWWGQIHADFRSENGKQSEMTSPADCLGCHK